MTAHDTEAQPGNGLEAMNARLREFAFEVGGLQRALEDGELDLQHCDTRLVPTEEVTDWLGGIIERLHADLVRLEVGNHGRA